MQLTQGSDVLRYSALCEFTSLARAVDSQLTTRNFSITARHHRLCRRPRDLQERSQSPFERVPSRKTIVAHTDMTGVPICTPPRLDGDFFS